MKRNTIYLLGIIIICLFSTCMNEHEKQSISTLPAFKHKIKMDEHLVKEIEVVDKWQYPEIKLIDSFLIVLSRTPDEYFIKVYKSNNLDLVTEFAKVGKGPDEFISLASLHVNEQSGELYFIDFPKAEFYAYKLRDILNSKYVKPLYSFELDKNLMPVFNYHVLENGNILLPTTTDTSLLTIINKKGKIVERIGSNKEPRNGLNGQHEFNYFYYKNLAYNPELKVCIGTFNFIDKVLMYDISKKDAHYYVNSKYKIIKPIASKGNIFNNYQAYTLDIQQTKKYVFASYLGGDYISPGLKVNHPTTIHVFDWNLNPIAELTFKEPIIDFAVDENGYIYTYCNSEFNQYKIYKVNLN